MKDYTRIVIWSLILATSAVCCFGTFLVLRDGLSYGFVEPISYAGIFFIKRFALQAVALGLVFTCLKVSYTYFLRRSENKVRVRLLYAAISLFAALAFVIPEYANHQIKVTIENMCTQYDLAIARQDYEAAYDMMSPPYRQTNSLTTFSRSSSTRIVCRAPDKRTQVLLFSPKASQAWIYHLPSGSLNRTIALEKVKDKWYFTGEVKLFH